MHNIHNILQILLTEPWRYKISLFPTKEQKKLSRKKSQHSFWIAIAGDSLDDLHLFAFLLFFSFWLTSKCLNYCLKASDFFCLFAVVVVVYFLPSSLGRNLREKRFITLLWQQKLKHLLQSFFLYILFSFCTFTVDYFALPGKPLC